MATMCIVSAGDKSGFLGAQLQVSSLRGAAAPCRARCVRVKASTAVADEEETEAGTSSSVAKPVPRLKSYYFEKVVPAMVDEFKYTNKMQVPKLEKVVVNCGSGEAAQNAKVLEGLQRDLALITGQKPVVTRAKKAVAAFKLRQGVPVGAAVTLRGEVMYSFLDRLINLAFPRTRDFQGVSPYSFDGQGNYSVGIREQSVFPEIKVDTIDKERGMDVAICTTASSDKEGQKLLSLLGMPFKENVPKPPKKRKNKRWNVKAKTSDTKTKAKAKKKK